MLIYLIMKNCKVINTIFTLLFFLYFNSHITLGQQNWIEKNDTSLKIIYKKDQSSLANNIVAFTKLYQNKLDSIFNYIPNEEIIINTYDYSDMGFAGTTTIPNDFIRVEIEPIEKAYENVLFKHRILWLISHELVHVIVNDQASNCENIARKLFMKVAPEQEQPLTVFYSLLTNFTRYTPTWYQEGIAVFFETWLNGGFGRVLGNFDEMYFRVLVAEHRKFPSLNKIESELSTTSFLQGMIYYLYGERFITYLAIKYGTKKLISWYRVKPGESYENYSCKFEKVFGIKLDVAWKDFSENEINFQIENISRIKKNKITNVKKITEDPVGWVTKAYYDPSDNSMILGYHKPNFLAGIEKLNLNSGSTTKIGTLPTPSILRVASTAFDKNRRAFFFTTKNNELFRDIRVLDIKTGNSKLLFQDCRVGDLTVSSKTHELWGVIHSNGKTGIVYSSYPYQKLQPVVGFEFGDDISDLSIDPEGHFIAGVLNRSDGSQLIFITSADTLKTSGKFKYLTVTSKGSPEFPSWSDDGKFLFWNAYVNGVSNIYRKNLSDDSEIEPLSNIIGGLFKPVFLNTDSLFAFEFTSDGFIPVVISNKPADYLSAIRYLGDSIVVKNPEVVSWNVVQNDSASVADSEPENEYNSLKNLNINTLIPVLSGFQNQKVLGIYTNISDPLLTNSLTMEFGISPFNKNSHLPELHFKGRYEFKKELTLNYEYNPSDFYDLLNKRKRAMSGSRYGIGYDKYWIYDNPLKFKQKFRLDYYSGINFLTDNIIKVSQPDFWIAQTEFNIKNLRRSIGSVDFEEGNEYSLSFLVFGSGWYYLSAAGQFIGEWNNFSTWLFAHNVFHFQLSGGYTTNSDKLIQSKFYIGGFGNRTVDNQEANQFRKPFSFPGISIYSLPADKFGKLLFENEFPPIRFSDMFLGDQYLSHISISLFSQVLLTNFNRIYPQIDLGSQINFELHHWFNLESTFSIGVAKSWFKKENSSEWFLSIKLLKN